MYVHHLYLSEPMWQGFSVTDARYSTLQKGVRSKAAKLLQSLPLVTFELIYHFKIFQEKINNLRFQPKHEHDMHDSSAQHFAHPEKKVQDFVGDRLLHFLGKFARAAEIQLHNSKTSWKEKNESKDS